MGLWNWLRGRETWDSAENGTASSSTAGDSVADPGLLDEQLEPVALEITDVLDLHSFAPKEVKAVVRDYLDAAYRRGLRSLRIIHGRGAGVQRKTVRVLLARDPRVLHFEDAPQEAGGWGATVVDLE